MKLYDDLKDFILEHKVASAILVLVLLFLFFGNQSVVYDIASGSQMKAMNNYEMADSGVMRSSVSSFAEPSVVSEDRKIKRTAYTRTISSNYDSDVQKVHGIYTKYEGYYTNQDENSYIVGDKPYRTFYITFKVPVKSFDLAINDLRQIGDVKSVNIDNSDLTENYQDLESRLESFKKEKTSIESLMDKAVDVEDLIKIQSRLSDVQREIDSIQQQLTNVERITDYSTISVTVEEKRPVSESVYHFTGIKQLSNNVIRSFDSIVVFASNIIGWIIALLVIMGIFKVYKRFR